MADDTQNAQGVSNPPNGGQITDIANPEDNDATVPLNTTPIAQPQGSSQAPQTPTPQAPQNVQTPGQPQDQGQGPQGKQPDLSKAPQPAPSGAPAPQQNQITAKASMFHDIAETLAGGPRYKYDTDAYGNTTRQPVPVSNAHLALAIAMEALTGGITGLANGQGPNGFGRGAAAAAAQGQQRVQQQDEQARKQAQIDFAQKAQTTETNMRMYTNARALGKMDYESNQANVDAYKDAADIMQTQYAKYVLGHGTYADMKNYNVTSEMAIPYKVVARRDPDTGKQVEINGVPQWDTDYLFIDPKFKADGLLNNPEMQKYLTETGRGDVAKSSLLGNVALEARLAFNLRSQARQWAVGGATLDNVFDKLDKSRETGTGGTDLKGGTLQTPDIKDQNIAGIVDNAATKYADSVKDIVSPDNFKSIVRAVVAQESGGNPNAKSPTGVKGLMQLDSGTAAALGVKDPFDPTQNADGGAHNLANLLNQFKDPKEAIAAYYSGPGAIKDGKIVDTYDSKGNIQHSAADTQKYVDQVSNRMGLTSPTPASTTAPKRISMAEYTAQNPQFPAALEKFMGAFNSTTGDQEGQIGPVLKHLTDSGQADAASQIAAFLTQNGKDPDAIRNYDDALIDERAQVKTDRATKAEEDRKAAAAKIASQANQEAFSRMEKILKGPDDFEFNDDWSKLGKRDLEKTLEAKGVTVPANFDDLYNIAKYKDNPANYSNKTWYKDYHMNESDAMSYIQKFINPDFDQKRYTALGTTARQLYNPDSHINRNIQAIGTATNHMEMLRQAAHDIASGQPLNGQFPALNRLAGEFQTQMGQSPYLTLQALTRRVNNEISNVAGGGFAPHAQDAEDTMKNMTAANSEQQIDNLLKIYTGIMQGRLQPVNDQIKALTGEDIKTISPETTALFQKYGFETPWAPKAKGQTGGQQPFKPQPGNANQYAKISRDGKLGIGADGKTYVIATGQPQ
jgi:soluble lytic murein transglycosylase-like protein